MDNPWTQLFESYNDRLRAVYLSQTPSERGKILGTIEELIEKYQV